MAVEVGQKEKWSEEACSDFAKRVRRFGIQVEELTLKPAPGPPKRTVDEQRDEEGKDILSRVGAGEGPLVVLDERGDQLDSLEFAKFLQVLPPVRRARADAHLTVAYATALRRQRRPCGDVRDRRSQRALTSGAGGRADARASHLVRPYGDEPPGLPRGTVGAAVPRVLHQQQRPLPQVAAGRRSGAV